MKYICEDIDLSSKPCSHYIKGGFCELGTHFRCIEYIREKEPVLSYSYIGTYKACPREFLLNWLMGYKLIEPKVSSEVSRIFHLYMESWYGGQAEPLIQAETLLQALEKRFPDESTRPNEIKSVAQVANAYYHIRQKGIERVRPLCKVEDRVTVFNNGYTLKNIIDMILKDGKVGYEWKFVKNPDIYGPFTMRLQLGCYFLSRPDLEKVIVRTIKKVDGWKVKQGKNETLEEYQQRVERTYVAQKSKNIESRTYYRTEFDLKRLEQEIRYMSAEIKTRIEAQSLAAWWQNQHCCYFSGMRDYTCDYLQCCEADIMPKNLPQIYRKINIERRMDTQ